MPKYLVLFASLTVFLWIACEDEPTTPIDPVDPFAELDLPEVAFDYTGVVLPEHYRVNFFPAAFQFQNAVTANDNTPNDNAVTNAGATLGRVLFYDKKLSANSTIACASCHVQAFGFSDVAALSLGFNSGMTRRHSMGLTNARFYQRGAFFWDERAASLEEQVLQPFQDPVEMGLSLEELINTLEAQPYYPPLFAEAFGSQEVTADRTARALAQFVRSIVSVDSRYDQARAEVDNPLMAFPTFTEAENRGKMLFFNPGPGRTPCLGCHATEAFINVAAGPTNNGLDAQSTDDLGVFETTNNPAQRGVFKVPSLKNIALTAPYMHDGRFDHLAEVIDHYSTGIQDHPNLSPALRNGNGDPLRYNFSEEEKADLIAFLQTLTDEALVNDLKFSNPFR